MLLRVCTFFCVFLCAASVHATTFRDVSLEELTDKSAIVVEAQITRTRFVAQKGRMPISTQSDLKVTRYLRGKGKSTLRLWQAGGELKGLTYKVHGSPKFKVGDRVVLFLSDSPKLGHNTVRLFALQLGAYRISKGSDGVMWAVSERMEQKSSPSVGVTSPESKTGALVTSSTRLPVALPLWQLVQRIKARK